MNLLKFSSIAVLTAFLFASGCRSTRLGPEPATPEFTISVTIDSIPSGADVYAIEEDGHLGRKLGTTPFVYECGIAPQYRFWSDTEEPAFVSGFWRWGEGTHWRQVKGRSTLFLDLALAKGDHSIGVASKEIFASPTWRSDEELRDLDIALTVPLKSLDQVKWEWQAYLQKKALSKEKRIIIQPEQGELTSINSSLETLIKLQQIQALQE
ncbi:MAG: hypothetical protein LAT55_02340 [Opitutales bacterium]|nr:hypothetical protein [Opitutales bacterium]